jgi:acyl carrier protein
MTESLNNETVEQRIRDFIARNLLYSADGYTLPDDASFLQNGIIDSLGVMELVDFVQLSFQVIVEQHEVVPGNFDSVTKLAAFVRWKQTASKEERGEPS